MKGRENLGVYINFPNVYHGAAQLEFNIPINDLQRIMLNTLYKLNGQSAGASLSSLIGPSIDVIPEFGVAEGLTFNYLNNDTLNMILNLINKRSVRILDFFCIMRYYKLMEGKRRSLRFDYYFLRFLFNNKFFEVQVFHERGLGRISIEDLIKFLVKNINMNLLKEGADLVKIRNLATRP
ncbi:MAG: hypothetical protein QXX94_02255 [Candidatus Bathyarchaeia archaeon]